MATYIFDAEEVESIIGDLGFNWEDHFDSYEEFYETIEETLKDNYKHCKNK